MPRPSPAAGSPRLRRRPFCGPRSKLLRSVQAVAVGFEQFPQGKGVKPVEPVAAQQGVAPSLIGVEAAAAGDKDFRPLAVRVEEAFEKALPAGVFVDFIFLLS